MAAGHQSSDTTRRDPPTDYTCDFVRSALPREARRLLEVGCGDGAHAARLQADGFEVVALDSDEDCVNAARSRGVDARRAAWPDFSAGRFDAVLFTRSLHHVGDLDAGVAAAFACLEPGGRVVVEDFDFGFADEPTLGWFAGLVRVLAAGGADAAASSFLAALAAGELTPLAAWRAEHDHELHSAALIEAALRRSAGSVAVDGAAYFFRYLAGALAPAQLEAVRAHELDLIGTGAIEPLGRRFVAEA